MPDMRKNHLHRRYDNDLQDWYDNYDDKGYWKPNINTEQREHNIRKFAEELKIAPTLHEIFIKSTVLKKIISKLRLSKSYVTRKDLVDIRSPIHKIVFELYGNTALVEETEYQMHFVVSSIRKRFSQKLFLLITTAFPKLRHFKSNEAMSTAPDVLKTLHVGSIICSAQNNRLPLSNTRENRDFSRQKKTNISHRALLSIIHQSNNSIDESYNNTLTFINNAIRKSGLLLKTNDTKLTYPDIYIQLYTITSEQL